MTLAGLGIKTALASADRKDVGDDLLSGPDRATLPRSGVGGSVAGSTPEVGLASVMVGGASAPGSAGLSTFVGSDFGDPFRIGLPAGTSRAMGPVPALPRNPRLP